MTTFGERLESISEATGLSIPEIASKIETAKTTLFRYRNGETQPPMDVLLRISSVFDVSPGWLLAGEGAMKRRDQGQVVSATRMGGGAEGEVFREPAATYDKDMPSIRMIPKRKARLCAGTGSLTTDESIAGYYAFREEFLARKGNPATMALVDVYGDSMEPEICDGDTVLVDESQKEIMLGRIYAVALDEEVMIKMVGKEPGKLLLISKNESYKPITIDMADVDGVVRIVGRVLWWCREAR